MFKSFGDIAIKADCPRIAVAILAESAMFWNIPGYCDRVEKTLATLVDREISTKILRYSGEVDINLLGAAIAALSIREDMS